MPASRRFLIACLVLLTATLAGRAAEQPEGVWSAPSLSKPDVSIIVTLLAGGKATEQIGDYHGEGTWKMEGNAARIFWASGWIGLLRPTPEGWELATWKKDTSLKNSPDDVQPATRVP